MKTTINWPKGEEFGVELVSGKFYVLQNKFTGTKRVALYINRTVEAGWTLQCFNYVSAGGFDACYSWDRREFVESAYYITPFLGSITFDATP